MPISAQKKRRVAAYARVSTEEDDQLSSYEAQVSYYSSFIKSNPEWEFVEVYSDEGISGTHTKKREGFLRMIDDAVNHKKIDLILTKSVSRFARNTVDSLSTIRLLKENGVEVYFEKENIYTFDSKGEMLLTIMSSIAQEESRSISENVSWGMQRRFEEGKYSVGYSTFLGYDKGNDGKLVINPEQAKTVRYIFTRFLEGKTPYSIAKELMERKMKTGAGNDKWSTESVVRILQNEKYCGKAILQKTYKRDLLSKRITNNGEVRKYLVENGHEAIIPPEQFEMAQQELESRRKETRQHSSKSIFTSKLVCGDCGSFYGSKVWHSTDKYRSVVWQCNNKFKADKKCTTPHLREGVIKNVFIKAVNSIVTDKGPAIDMMNHIKAKIDDTAALEGKLEKATTAFDEKMVLLQDYISKNAITEKELADGRYSELEKDYREALAEKEKLQDELTERKRRSLMIKRFIDEVISFDDLFTEFSENLWLGLVDVIVVMDKKKFMVKFKGGMEVPVEL
ncbi:recombinase family protein [Spirochaetales bacterium NM-380-WT-3C1]|uniref:Recombinase family protein n=1 Tax=Bullifex porci TaxID=2606638 RepID=A0A7X2PBN4_9SPIO|nr:recombinase family protein [Bullifex porci]MSU05919.1 recombinase family protein [Bullifex porci]